MNDRGSISIWIACALPVFMLAIALPVETGQWQVNKIELQSTADLASMAGIDEYKVSLNNHVPAITAKSNAITTAVAIAKANGHTATAEWITGIFDSTAQGLKISINKSVPLLFMASLNQSGAFTVTVTGTSELMKDTGGTWSHCNVITLPITCVAGVTR